VTTAFQPDLFQSDAFQIAGGVAATDFQVTIAFTQDSDGFNLQLNLPSMEGADSSKRRRHRREKYVTVYKDREYEFDSLEELQEFLNSKKAPAPRALSPSAREEFYEDAEVAVAPASKVTARFIPIPRYTPPIDAFSVELAFEELTAEDEEDVAYLLASGLL
jgi:hypothetical protein